MKTSIQIYTKSIDIIDNSAKVLLIKNTQWK